MSTKKITGIVLAGGKSSRMGKDKSLMLFRGKPLICYAIEAIAPLCNKVIISSRHNNYSFTNCEVWHDEFEDHAPIIGIYSCLKHSTTNFNIILSCDMPLVNTALFAHLLTFSTESDIVIPVHSQHLIEPLCGIYNKNTVPLLQQAISLKGYKMIDFIRTANHKIVTIDSNNDFYNTSLFSNFNSVDDFSKLKDC